MLGRACWDHTLLPPPAGPSTLEGARLVPRGVKLLSAEFPKEEVDEANKVKTLEEATVIE